MLTKLNLSQLQEDGYTIVDKVIYKSTCDFLTKRYTKMCKNGKHFKGIRNSNIAHDDYLWRLRINENIFNIFSSIHNTTELIPSIDVIGVVPPKSKWSSWYHHDQQKSDKYWVQGVLQLSDDQENSSTFVCFPGTHKIHTKTTKSNHKASVYTEKGYTQKVVHIPKRSLLLFDSRLVHCNRSPGIHCNTTRVVFYICMFPVNRVDTEAYTKAYKIGISTNNQGLSLYKQGRYDIAKPKVNYLDYFDIPISVSGIPTSKVLLANMTYFNDLVHIPNYTTIKATSKSKEYKSLSPFYLKTRKNIVIENLWQYSKVYTDMTYTKWTMWKNYGLTLQEAQRYPRGKTPPKYDRFEYNNKSYTKSEARLLLYTKSYIESVVGEVRFAQLANLLASGRNIVLVDYHIETNKTHKCGVKYFEITQDNYKDTILNVKHLSHSYILAMALLGINVDYTIN